MIKRYGANVSPCSTPTFTGWRHNKISKYKDLEIWFESSSAFFSCYAIFCLVHRHVFPCSLVHLPDSDQSKLFVGFTNLWKLIGFTRIWVIACFQNSSGIFQVLLPTSFLDSFWFVSSDYTHSNNSMWITFFHLVVPVVVLFLSLSLYIYIYIYI